MKKLLIISGKGGTGKTTAAAAFIRFSGAKAFADCDVDAPNLHLVTPMTSQPLRSVYYGAGKSRIEPDKCIGCGKCAQACRFSAIVSEGGAYRVNEYACEGCGVCALVCPAGAAALTDDAAGDLSLYREDRVFSTAELKMGRGSSGKLVSAVKAALMKAAPEAELAIIDGSPGIGCPVIASVSGVDMALIVTEPSLSGLSDLKRLLKTVAAFQTRAAVCVNRFDISPAHTRLIEEYCAQTGVPFVGRIPYDKAALAAINAGKSLADTDCAAGRALREIYENTLKLLKEKTL